MEACCGCGGGSTDPRTSCNTPKGDSWEETALDCASAGLEPIDTTVFGVVRECDGGVCGIPDCCVPTHCYDVPGWVSSSGYDCASIHSYGYCASTDSEYASADGVTPGEACCACGGGSTEPYLSCNTPTGGLPDDETAVDCAGAGRTAWAPEVFVVAGV